MLRHGGRHDMTWVSYIFPLFMIPFFSRIFQNTPAQSEIESSYFLHNLFDMQLNVSPKAYYSGA